jgi:ABC-type multidrug transport system fused ATPase/permease subunit
MLNEVDVKDTYMWNMATYLYDYDTVQGYLFGKDETSTRATTELNENEKKEGFDYKKLEEEDLRFTKIYRYYHDRSGFFIIYMIILFILSFGIYLFASSLGDLKMCMSGDVGNDANITEYFRYYLYGFVLYILLFATFFGIISKKITEIYKSNDTETYEYIMLMKELDIILKENKITEPDNNAIIDILKKHSKSKINDIRYIAIYNKDAMYKLAVAQKAKSEKAEKKYKNTNDNTDKLIRLKNINRLVYYNSEEAKNKVKGKVADIFRFIYAYLFFLIVPIYLLSISLKGNYIYLLFTLILIIVFSISVYNIYNTLQ